MTPIYRRGESLPQTLLVLAGKAILAACEDAGIPVRDVDGFVYYAGGGVGLHEGTIETASLVETLGMPEVGFSSSVSGSGGGSAGAIGLAALAVEAGQARNVVVVFGLQQSGLRFGETVRQAPSTPQNAFYKPHGFVGPGFFMALMAQRHMHLYGTRREAFAEVAIASRSHAMRQPGARRKEPLSLEDYFAARMIAEPLCLYDFCMECDGAAAVVVTTEERARDGRHRPVRVVGAVQGGPRDWGYAFLWGNQSDVTFASAGYEWIGKRLYERAGVGPGDVDVALLYDHFTPFVVMQLEDFGFCERGEGGAFVESGAMRHGSGSIPTNTHGGALSEAYLVGLNHVLEGVRQIRGTAANQVPGAELALVSGGPAPLPLSAVLLGA